MKVVALCSGGKDSCYSIQLCKQHGHDVVALANLLPEDTAPDELDSFCFQTVGHQLVGEYAACMGVPLFRKRISGTSSVQDLGYSPTDGDEVEDLFQLLAFVKENIPGMQAVASGAIASDYQRLRVENVCSRLNLVSLAYLWHQPQRLLLRGMIASGIEAILVKVACLGLSPRKHLGRTIAAMEPTLLALADTYGCNVCGEGGEYETLTLDCPVFTRGFIELLEREVVYGSGDVGHLVPKACRVVPKPGWEGCDLPADVRHVPAEYVPSAPRFSRCSSGPAQVPSSPPPGPVVAAAAAASSPPQAAPIAAAAAAAAAASATNSSISGGSGGGSGGGVDPMLLQPVAPSAFSVQVSLCSGPDYVQLVCRAVRTRSALPSDVTECDTTAALHALLTTAQQELASQYMDLRHCLFVHLFLANMGHFQAANGVYCKHFPCRDPPSRACVQVCLPHDCPVMCEFLLARGSAPPAPLPGGGGALSPGAPLPPRHVRRVLHVQSISSWAPSCIGPYSQATAYRGLVYLAGVIPLDPPVMTLVPGDITAQVLRAMTSCEAVAVAQRTTMVGATLGLTVYLSAGGVGVGASGGGAGGGGAPCSAERSCGSTSGAELRALARSAVEALLDHGLPGHPQYHARSPTPTSATPRGNTTPGIMPLPTTNGISAPGSRRGPVILGADGLDEEEEEEAAAAELQGRATVTGSGVGLPSGGPGAAGAAVLDSYLQPPEVRTTVRPSVLYVTVPSLPRGSLVEIQPVCLDVETLAVIRRLAGHESFVRRRNSSVHDATTLLQQAAAQQYQHQQQHQQHQLQPGHASAHALHCPPALSTQSAFVGSPLSSTGGATVTWSDLPRTPRGSMESMATSGAAPGSFNRCMLAAAGALAGAPTHGSPGHAPWYAATGEPLSAPLPSHVIAAGYLSPDTGGSLAGTPTAGPLMLARQRSSGLGLLGGAGSGSGVLNRCNSPGVGGPQGSGPAGAAGGSGHGGGGSVVPPPGLQVTPPPPSAHASGHQLLSPTLQHLLDLQLPKSDSPPPVPPTEDLPSQQNLQQQQQQDRKQQQQQQHWLKRQQMLGGDSFGSNSSSGHAGGTGTMVPSPLLRQWLSSGNGAPAAATAAVAAAAAGAARAGTNSGQPVPFSRASYSGSSNSSGPPMPRSSLDGNILSFEVSSGRGLSSYGLATSPLPNHQGGYSLPGGLGIPPSAFFSAGGGGGGADNSGSGGSWAVHSSAGSFSAGINGPLARARPPSISVPHPSTGSSSSATPLQPLQRSQFETTSGPAQSAGAATTIAAASAGQIPPQVPPSVRVGGPPPPTRIPSGNARTGLPAAAAMALSSGGGGFGSGCSMAVELSSPLPPQPPPLPPVSPVIATPPAAAASGSSDVMVTTVWSYGQVLRSLFHLPPAIFAPGVTTAQLTRRFRRAAASVLAAHGMDMSCLIWVRVWYEKGSVGLTDDEFGFCLRPTAAGGPAAGGGAAAAAATAGAYTQVMHALDDEEDVSAFPSGRCDPRRGRGGGSGGDSSSNGSSGSGEVDAGVTTGRPVMPVAAAAAAGVLGSCSDGCSSPRPSGLPVSGPQIADAAISPIRIRSPAPPCQGSEAGFRSHAGQTPAASAVAAEGGLVPPPQQQQHQVSPGGLPTHHSNPSAHPHHHSHQHQPQHQQAYQHSHSHHLHPNHHQLHPTHPHPHPQPQPQHQQPQPQQPQQHFHVSWVPVQKVATNANPQPVACVAVLELLAALPTP